MYSLWLNMWVLPSSSSSSSASSSCSWGCYSNVCWFIHPRHITVAIFDHYRPYLSELYRNLTERILGVCCMCLICRTLNRNTSFSGSSEPLAVPTWARIKMQRPRMGWNAQQPKVSLVIKIWVLRRNPLKIHDPSKSG